MRRLTFEKVIKARNFMQMNLNNKGPTVVSLFSGCGGMDLGFIMAGYKVIWANECWKDAADTYEHNLGKHVDRRKIEDVPSKEIPDCDVVVGGPPCQAFSLAKGKRFLTDPRAKLVFEFVRVVKDKMPRAFVLENVPGLCSFGGYETPADKKRHTGRHLKELLKSFQGAGYEVSWAILNAANYGVPQHRRRIFIIGRRIDFMIIRGVANKETLKAYGLSRQKIGLKVITGEIEPQCLQP